MNHAEPLPVTDRHKYLHRVAALLHGVEVGDASVARAARQAQSELFRAPMLPSNTGVPSRTRKLQRGAPPSA